MRRSGCSPRGERDWAAGWDESVAGQRIGYTRVTPEVSAGTVMVTLEGADDHSDVTVTYRLTALGPHGETQPQELAEGYGSFLESWQDAIAGWLPGGGAQ
jgi:hypothetical protein